MRPPPSAQRPPSLPSILDALTALVDQSLLQRVPGPGNQTRFAMLEPVREYGLERLAASGEEAIVRDAHAAWCLALAERANPELSGAQQVIWFERLEAEQPNMRAALTWFQQSVDAERGLRLATALTWFWTSRGYLREAQGWFDAFLSVPADVAPLTRARALVEAANVAHWQRADERAVACAEEALGIFRDLDDRLNTAYALRRLGSIAIDRNDVDHATTLLAESGEILRAAGAAWDGAFDIYLAGRLATAAGKSEEAVSRFAEAAEAFRAIGDHDYVAAALGQRGAALSRIGDLAGARAAYAASLALAHEHNEQSWIAWALAGAAQIAHASGVPAAAARLLGAAAAIREAIGERDEPDDGLTDAVRSALGDERFGAEWRHGMHLPETQALAEARAILAGSTRRSRSLGRERVRHPIPLTVREREVLRLLVDGLSDKEIATALGISHSTVSDHVAAIRAKLGVASRAAAAALAVRSGLLSS